MKKLLFCILLGLSVIMLNNCVTRQKYNELEAQYKTCNNDLTFKTSENIDLENSKKQLDLEVGQLKNKVETLKADTLSLSRKVKQLDRENAKSRKDYDDLLKDFTELNIVKSSESDKYLASIEEMRTKLEEREKELNNKQDALDSAKSDLSSKETRLRELQNILDQKDKEVRALKDKVTDALQGFENSGLNIYEKNGKVYVSMEDKLLFASGSWEIGSEGLKAIKEIAAILENEETISVLIEGHTDNVIYKGSGQVKDNWDLSVMRATAVVKALLKNGNILPSRLSASGRSEFCPVSTEDTPQARAHNRRTEIILTPKLDELFSIIESN